MIKGGTPLEGSPLPGPGSTGGFSGTHHPGFLAQLLEEGIGSYRESQEYPDARQQDSETREQSGNKELEDEPYPGADS